MKDIRLVSPGKNGNVINEFGLEEAPPQNWAFLKSGDAGLTRKVTAKGVYWRVQTKKGRRLISQGIWAPVENILAGKQEIAETRNDPNYARKKLQAKKSRDKKQATYAIEFEGAVATHLNFHERFKTMEIQLAKIITEHAIPVGSGTVARTSQIPINERAAKAVNGWMRHQTTNYDQMKIARIKGERRSVRQKLAKQSNSLLNSYRQGVEANPNCPLAKALKLNKK